MFAVEVTEPDVDVPVLVPTPEVASVPEHVQGKVSPAVIDVEEHVAVAVGEVVSICTTRVLFKLLVPLVAVTAPIVSLRYILIVLFPSLKSLIFKAVLALVFEALHHPVVKAV